MEEEGKVKKVKSNKGLILFLLLIIIALVGYIAYDKMYLSVGTTCGNSDTKIEDTVEELDVNSQEVKDIMNSYYQLYIKKDNLYKYGKFSINTISDEELVGTSIKNLEDGKINYCIGDISEVKETVSIKELNESLKKYVLNREINLGMITDLNTESSYPVAQYEVNGIGIIVNENISLVGPCDGAYGPQDYVEDEIIKVIKEDEYVYVYEKQAYAKYNADNDEYLYYNNYLYEGKYKEAVDYQSIVSLNWDLYNTYKYTFIKVDDKYYFQSFELEV